MYEREKETAVDKQHMRGIWNSKETSCDVMCLSDGSQWPAKQQNTRKKMKKKKKKNRKKNYTWRELCTVHNAKTNHVISVRFFQLHVL